VRPWPRHAHAAPPAMRPTCRIPKVRVIVSLVYRRLTHGLLIGGGGHSAAAAACRRSDSVLERSLNSTLDLASVEMGFLFVCDFRDRLWTNVHLFALAPVAWVSHAQTIKGWQRPRAVLAPL